MSKNSSQAIENSAQQLRKQGINPDYTFKNFLTNSSDAPWIYTCKKAAAIAVESITYSPLFLYGSIGSGKTHLAHAIANSLVSTGYQHLICTTGANFSRDIITAFRQHKTEAFREKYDQADALIIDNIDFIIRKEKTIQAFLVLYNSWCLQRKPLIVTARCAPRITFYAPYSLSSRLTAGQVICIPKPDTTTLKNYLQRRLSENHIELNTELSDMLASNLTSIRELQGAINTLNISAKYNGKPVNLAFIEQILRAHQLCAAVPELVKNPYM